MTGWSWAGIAATLAVGLYTYVGYPLLLRLLAAGRSAPLLSAPDGDGWPAVGVSLPAYNEAHQIGDTLESLLALDYPMERRQIVVVSDASTDGTDEIVASYADRGVQLVRQPERRGKTAAEELAARHINADIVINTDASIRIHPDSLKRIVAPFADPGVGLASGRDVSVTRVDDDANTAEAGYVGYEMWIRDLETRVGGIVGASGSFYAIRRALHVQPLPASLSRDFAAALHTREAGFRGVSVSDATCSVPRTASLRREYRRKVRTMARGMETLLHKRALLNPFRYGRFSWMLLSHKVCRWAAPWIALLGLAGLIGLASTHAWAQALLALAALMGILIVLAWVLDGRRLPRVLSMAAFAVTANVAVLHAGLRVVIGDRNPTWEPTRRTAS